MKPMRQFVAAVLLPLLAACAQPAEVQAQAAEAITDAQQDAAETVGPAVQETRTSVAEVLVPAIVDVREIVEEALPPTTGALSPPSPAAVALIVRYEISSPAYYVKRLQRPVWPGGASGVTWGVGYDGGHQTRQRIAGDWAEHPAAAELSTTAGIVGQRARVVLPAYRHIVTPLEIAQSVFRDSTLPEYHALAARAFRDGWDHLPPDAQGSLTATVYNRGAGMTGERRREMRVLRDECVPNGDIACMVVQFRSMCRIWRGTTVEAGLCARYEATARLAAGQWS